jgi:hypothetical protein
VPVTVDPKTFIPLPEEWLAEQHVAIAFLLGVLAGGRLGSLIIPPAEAVLDATSDAPIPSGVVDDIVTSMIRSIGGVP